MLSYAMPTPIHLIYSEMRLYFYYRAQHSSKHMSRRDFIQIDFSIENAGNKRVAQHNSAQEEQTWVTGPDL